MTVASQEPRKWIENRKQRKEFGSPLASFDELGWVVPTSPEEQAHILAAQEQHLIAASLRKTAYEQHLIAANPLRTKEGQQFDLRDAERALDDIKDDVARARAARALDDEVQAVADQKLFPCTSFGTLDQLKKVFKGETALKNAQRIDLLLAHTALKRGTHRREPADNDDSQSTPLDFKPELRLTDLANTVTSVVHW